MNARGVPIFKLLIFKGKWKEGEEKTRKSVPWQWQKNPAGLLN